MRVMFQYFMQLQLCVNENWKVSGERDGNRGPCLFVVWDLETLSNDTFARGKQRIFYDEFTEKSVV